MTTEHTVAPGRGSLWRPRTKGERTDKCSAIGLKRGDCSQPACDGVYCYYHSKVCNGVVTNFVDHRNNAVPATHRYPVWPLPQGGYVLLDYEEVST